MQISPLFLVLMSGIFLLLCTADREIVTEGPCDCDYCSKNAGVIPLNKEVKKEEAICARAHNLPDRNFQTVCHMLCHNRCTRFNVTVMVEGVNATRRVATARRTNYYKLREGPCGKA